VSRLSGRLSTICGKLRSMRLPLLILAAVLATPSVSSAQTSDGGVGAALSPSMAASLNNMHMTIRRDLIEAAEAMPAADFAFKPTPQVRSFGEILGHVAFANFYFCAMAKGEPPRPRSITSGRSLTSPVW
jgi:DinB superfamily